MANWSEMQLALFGGSSTDVNMFGGKKGFQTRAWSIFFRGIFFLFQRVVTGASDHFRPGEKKPLD